MVENTRRFKKHIIANGNVVWFHYLNVHGGANRYTILCN